MKHRLIFISAAILLPALIAATPTFAATVAVGTCMPGKVSYDNLTDAVQGVPTGSTILVCPGSYAEQIVINKSMTLKGVTNGNSGYPVLVPPAGGMVTNATGLNVFSFFGAGTQFAAQIVITGGVTVTLSGLALDATGYNLPTCYPVVVGVLIQDSSATLAGMAIKNQLETGPPPCNAAGSGAGVLAQNDTGLALTVNVHDSTFVNAAQTFESDGATTTSTFNNNSLIGNPASNANAINILSGNSTIQGNSISDFNYPLAGTNINAAAYGIFIECVPGGTVAGNTISNSQVGIYLYNGCATNSVSVTGNKISDAAFIGIDVGSLNGLVQNNDIRTTQTAIRIPGSSAGNTIQGNNINDTCAAFGANPAAGTNNLLNNTVFNAQNLAIVNTTALCP
jgi:parallel beta-helix repeat protein